jgi:hypothetical protein
VNGVASSAASATIGHDQVISTAIDELRSGLRGTDHALSLFVTTMGSPMFERTQPEIEQDLWIRWLSQRSPDQRIPGPAEARMRTRRVFARLVPENVGYFHEELMPLAAAEARRLERVGRPGVVIVPPRHRENSTRFEPGVVHLRHDTYAATGRVDPEQYVDEYLEIAHQPGVFLRTGEVVIVDATTSSMVTASRTGREVRTSETEQQVARRMLGIKSFTPEAADTRAPLVARGLKEEGLPVTVTSTEDGALVVDPEGRPVILFAPHTDVVEAEGRLERTGALRVVAIGMDPRHAVSDYRSARVLVTTGSSFDHALLVREVRSALAALYQRGTTVPLPPPPALRAADVNRATGVTGSSKR